MQQKKIPMRKCIGCNESKPKKELVRIVRTPDEDIILDITGKKNGRGAYICNDAQCLKKARNAKRLEKIFECSVPDAVYDEAERLLSQN